MGHTGNGTCRTLALIRLSVFRDRILEPRYYDPYLQKTITTSLTYITSIPRYYVTVLRVTSEPTVTFYLINAVIKTLKHSITSYYEVLLILYNNITPL